MNITVNEVVSLKNAYTNIKEVLQLAAESGTNDLAAKARRCTIPLRHFERLIDTLGESRVTIIK